MPLAERLSSKLHSCLGSFLDALTTVSFSDNLSAMSNVPADIRDLSCINQALLN